MMSSWLAVHEILTVQNQFCFKCFSSYAHFCFQFLLFISLIYLCIYLFIQLFIYIFVFLFICLFHLLTNCFIFVVSHLYSQLAVSSIILAGWHCKGGGSHLEQASIRLTTTESIEGGQHPTSEWETPKWSQVCISPPLCPPQIVWPWTD